MRPPPPQEKPPAGDAYAQQGAYEQDPYAGSQGGYQPDYNQQGYNQVTSVSATWMSHHCHQFLLILTLINALFLCLFKEAQYGQGYAQQGGPTSFSNQMWANKVCVLRRGIQCSRILGQNLNNWCFFPSP